MRPNRAPKGVGSGVLFTDAAVETAIRDALSGAAELKVDDLVIRVKSGKVRLEGRVPNPIQMARVGAATAQVDGVKGVENKLRVLG